MTSVAHASYRLLLAVCLLCASCRRDDAVAELVDKHSSVERDFAQAQSIWTTAEPGARFKMGDALRTGSDAHATLALSQQGRLLVKSSTVVRFMTGLDAAQPKQQFDVLQGELTLESGDQPLAVKTSSGLVRIQPATTVRVHADAIASRFDVEVGRVDYTLNGRPQVVEAGKSFELEVLEVSVERGSKTEQAQPAQPTAAIPISPDAATPADVVAPAQLPVPEPTDREVFLPSPPTALVRFAAGETITVHDPAPPTDVALTIAGCSQLSVLELERGSQRQRFRSDTNNEARARVSAGSYKYRVRCASDGRVVSTGQLKVVLDAATRPLPLAPVTVTADADGRRYTVSYQNRLPVITLRWPYAPRAEAYQLHVEPARSAQFTINAKQSSMTLPSGRLGEGLHHFWFETADRKRSETGVLQVSFDYTARTAYLTSPVEGETLQTQNAVFAGGALLGSQVVLQGTPLTLDSHGRFSASTNVDPESHGAAVRVQSPTAGIHYYVRHLAR